MRSDLKINIVSHIIRGLALLSCCGATACGGDNAKSPVTSTLEVPTSASVVGSAPLPLLSAISTQSSESSSKLQAEEINKTKPIFGVNIAGGEFGRVPGRIGYDYDYPARTDIDYYYNQGFRMIRIPFRWERLQPIMNGPLIVADRAALKKATDYAVSKGMVVVLDMHDYAARKPNPTAVNKALIGSAEVPKDAYSDAWKRIAEDYKDNPNVWLGLMNEPSGITAAAWWEVVQAVVLDLREANVRNKLLIPGASWTGAHSWIKSGNSSYAKSFIDPDNNFAFELHQYLDADSSGTKAECTISSNKRIDAALEWATSNNVKLFFGEIGAGSDVNCASEYALLLEKLNGNAAVIGWTAWGGGKWWKQDYMFRLNPVVGDTPTTHMTMLKSAMSMQK